MAAHNTMIERKVNPSSYDAQNHPPDLGIHLIYSIEELKSSYESQTLDIGM
jgi:hypothetical protein